MKDEQNEKTAPIHSVFVDLSLENDLQGEELEWFKSRIAPQKPLDKKKKQLPTAPKKVEIISEYECNRNTEKLNKIFLKLQETEMIWFLSLETCYSQENDEDIEKVRRENATYEMKKTKKEIIRKRCMADAQTPCFITKSKETLTTEIIMKNVTVFASEWDMYDTYNAYLTSTFDTTTEDQIENTAKPSVISSPQKATETFSSLSFKYASLITERLLASNCFQAKQSVFKKDFRTRYDTEPTKFSYNVQELWNFHKESNNSLTVTDMDWNPFNEDLLAVGYGDLNFIQDNKFFGAICIWSSKNPRQPERQYNFDDSVTSLHHSRFRPNILAVGTRSGNVYVVDISTNDDKKRNLRRDLSNTHPGPVWKVEWFLNKELVFETEDLLAIGESGILMVFSTCIDKDVKDILKLEYVTTTKKLPEKQSVKKYNRPLTFHGETFDRKTFSGLHFSLFSNKTFCYISTKEGIVVKCDLRNPSMTRATLLAHNGPVYTIQHSPVTDLIYLTCGADCKLKIWMEGVDKPLVTLQQKAPILCAKWSPTIPTLIASLDESELSLWDIGRNILSPMSVKKFEDSKNLCNLLFSSNGANLMVGCDVSLVRVLHLTDLPRIPFLQKEALISALRRTLLRNENELFEKFSRQVQANEDKLKTNILHELTSSSSSAPQERTNLQEAKPLPNN